MAILGLVDDVRTVSPWHRLAAETVLGAALIGVLWSDLEWLALPAAGLAFVAVPLLVNATNLVDNADGVAAAMSAVTGLGLAGLAALVGSNPVAITALVIPAACIAFLAYNLPPARVYMGDVGSLALGVFLAIVTALVARHAVAAEPVRFEILAALPSIWALQLGDLAMVLITRFQRGVSPFRGGVDHTSHRLMRAGLGPRTMLGAIGGLAVTFVGVAVLGPLMGSATITAILTLMIVLTVAAAEYALATRIPHE